MFRGVRGLLLLGENWVSYERVTKVSFDKNARVKLKVVS